MFSPLNTLTSHGFKGFLSIQSSQRVVLANWEGGKSDNAHLGDLHFIKSKVMIIYCINVYIDMWKYIHNPLYTLKHKENLQSISSLEDEFDEDECLTIIKKLMVGHYSQSDWRLNNIIFKKIKQLYGIKSSAIWIGKSLSSWIGTIL